VPYFHAPFFDETGGEAPYAPVFLRTVLLLETIFLYYRIQVFFTL
jgi:hypothetical protein